MKAPRRMVPVPLSSDMRHPAPNMPSTYSMIRRLEGEAWSEGWGAGRERGERYDSGLLTSRRRRRMRLHPERGRTRTESKGRMCPKTPMISVKDGCTRVRSVR